MQQKMITKAQIDIIEKKLDIIIEQLQTEKEEVQPETRKRLNAKEVGELYGVSDQTVKTWAREGGIPSYKTTGGRWFFYQDELDAAEQKRFK